MSSPNRQLGWTLLLAIVAVSGAGTLHAQAVPRNIVRITGLEFTYVGEFLRVDTSALVMYSDKGDTLTIPLTQIERAERLAGRYRGGASHFRKGVKIGLIGGVVLAGASLVASGRESGESQALAPVFAVFSFLVGTTAGVVGGTIAAFVPVDEWRTFDVRGAAVP